MAANAERLGLGPDEFAFHFATRDGVNAIALTTFLKHAATVAQRHGAELLVVGLREGSLDTIVRAIRKGATREFEERPVDTTVKSSAFVGGIVIGIINMMSPQLSGATQIAKSGAAIIEKHQVAEITILTNQNSTVVMNGKIAKAVREAGKRQHMPVTSATIPQLSAPVASMVRDAHSGYLLGDVSLVKGELHFRPAGHRYWVPVYENAIVKNSPLHPGTPYRISGQIILSKGQPDRIIIEHAVPISD